MSRIAMRVVEILLSFVPVAIRQRFRPTRNPHLAIYRKRDAERNSATTPPEDEGVDLCCAWGIEFYTPTYIPNLIEGFRELGWHTNDHNDPRREPEAWLRRLRRFQFDSASMSLGYLVPNDSGPLFIGAERRVASLPKCAQYARIGIYSISPSLVSVVVCFVFDDETSTILDRALRTNRETFTTPIPRGHRIHDVRSQKSGHIRRIRSNINRQIGTWFSANLPGLFSSGILDRDIPTCEFITLLKSEPFPSRIERQANSQMHLELLGLSRDFDVWKNSRTPGLKFRMKDRIERNPRYHSILATREERHIDGMPDSWAKTDRDARIAHVDEFMPNLLNLCSILPMLEGYTQHLSTVRDSATASPGDRLAPARVLERLRGDVAYSVDIAAVTAELSMYAEEAFPLVSDVEDFEPCDARLYETRTNLREQLEFIVHKQATWLERTDKSIRDHLTQYGSLVGAAQNVRMQARITLLTWALLILAAATLVANVLVFLMRDGTFELPLF